MNGDNRLHLGVICRQSVEEADLDWAVCVRDVHRTLDRLRTLLGALAGRHAMPSPWAQVQGLLLRSGLDFEARRWSMNGADLKALEVFGEWSTSAEAVVQDPGGDF